MPPKMPAPSRRVLLMLEDKLAMPHRTDKILKRKIPMGLPNSSPKKMPRLSGDSRDCVMSALIVIAVFDRANNGRMR